MADVIGRGDYEAGFDASGVERGVDEAERAIKESGQEAERVYREAGDRAGKLFSQALDVGLRGAAMVATTAFAVAGRGLAELSTLQADFRAETGATADEAERAGDAINRMSGRNLQPLGEIGAALTKVHTDLGLTGDEAEATTETFLRFATATKQEASAAVLAFDDILDAWGLTAADSGQIMDQLILSHQRYGGSIEENQRVLGAMAPQLQALNMTLDDGLGLLNLFAASGLDAAGAQRALNSAIANLPEGESLEQFLVRLSKVENNTERAQLAAEVFGQRAGAGLANAIKPGVAGLGDFIVTAEEAGGTMVDAAEAMESSFGAQLQLKIKQVSSLLLDLARDAGPVVTVFGGVASAATALGGGRFLGAVVAAFRKVGKAGGEALIDAAGTATGAAGTVFGNVIAQPIIDVFDPDKNSLLGRGIRTAGSKAATLYLKALYAVDAITGVLSRALTGTGVMGVIGRAGADAGKAYGMVMGSRAGIAFRAAFLAAILLVADDAKRIADETGDDIGDSLFGADRWTMPELPWPLGNKDAPDWAKAERDAEEGGRSVGEATVRGMEAAIAPGGGVVSGAVAGIGASLGSFAGTVPGMLGPVRDEFDSVGSKASDSAIVVGNSVSTMVTAILAMRASLVADAQTTADAIWDPWIAKQRQAALEAQIAQINIELADEATTSSRARELVAQRTTLEKELFIQNGIVASYGDAQAQIAHEKATLERVMVEAQQRGITTDLGLELVERGNVHRLNIDRMERDAAGGAADIRDGFMGPLNRMPGLVGGVTSRVRSTLGGMDDVDAFGMGEGIGQNLAAGLASQIGNVAGKAGALAGANFANLRTGSPAKEGPLSLYGGPGAWAEHLVDDYARHLAALPGRIAAITQRAAAELAMLTTAASPSIALGAVGATGIMGGAGSSTTSTVTTVHHGAPVVHLGGVTIQSDGPLDTSEQGVARLAERLAEHIRLSLA